MKTIKKNLYNKKTNRKNKKEMLIFFQQISPLYYPLKNKEEKLIFLFCKTR